MRSLLITSALLLTLPSACSRTSPPAATETPSPLSFPSPIAPASPSSSSQPVADPFVEADDTAQGAIALTQSAVSSEDWQMVVRQWERAISLLEAVPDDHPQKTLAREKLVGYRENLTYAQQQAQNKSPQSQQQSSPLPASGIPVSIVRGSPSEQSEDSPKVSLAKHLSSIGAKMYSTASCEECQEQREKFGDAFTRATEVECRLDNSDSPSDVCQKAGVKTFPTWEVNGQLYPGIRSLEDLADVSQYQGDRNFYRETATDDPPSTRN
ncbi:MAG: hypothetical protein SW833_27345 [Cyanobacteriota bacterium]|nr:hypothetical protein [Cyanobacteriota bacterium]